MGSFATTSRSAASRGTRSRSASRRNTSLRGFAASRGAAALLAAGVAASQLGLQFGQEAAMALGGALATASRRSTRSRAQAAGTQALGASQQAGAQQPFSQQGWQQANLAFSSAKRQRWHLGAHSQPQAGAQAAGAQGAGAGRRSAGAQALGASQQAGAQQPFSQQGWQQAHLAFSRSNRQGRQLLGTQPQAGSQHLGASQAGAQAHRPWGPRSKPEHSSSSRSKDGSKPVSPSGARTGRGGSSSERMPRYNRRPAHMPCRPRTPSGLHNSPGNQTDWPEHCWWRPQRSTRKGPPPTTEIDASWELLLVTKTQWENNATSVNRGFGSDLAILSTKDRAVF